MIMTVDEILHYCLNTMPGCVAVDSYGEKAIFYNPYGNMKRGIYVLTVKERDGANDKSSNLNREGVYRINIGVRKDTFLKMFDVVPDRPAKGGVVDMEYDFSQIDRLLPHPIYAWMSWICVLSPSEQTFEKLKPLIAEGYEHAKEKFLKKNDTRGK